MVIAAISGSTLSRFLVEAKKKTWASGAKEEEHFGLKIVRPFTKRYDDFSLRYADHYAGGEPFQGLELVTADFHHATDEWIPVWAMTYRGEYTGTEKEHPKINDLLRKALKAVPVDAPFRGPPAFKVNGGKYFYMNLFSGDLKSFEGTEQIGDKVKCRYVHKCEYQGGLVQRRVFV